MTAPKSLQWRLSLWLGLSIALVWAVAAAVTTQNLRHQMDEVFDSELAETGQRLLPLAVRDIIGRDSDDSASQSVATMREHDEHFTYLVRNADGQTLLRSHSADPAVFPPFSGMGFSDTPTHRLYSDAALQGTITITVAEPHARRRAVARDVLVGLARPLALIVPLSLIGIWAVVRLSTTSLRRFRSEIELRGAGDLTAVAAGGLPSEIRPVEQAVNQLLERLRCALEAERSFAANSAHELRTPVAAALAQTQRLIIETTDGAARKRARDIEAALRRLSDLSEKLMQLAKAEGGRLHGAEAVDTGTILRIIVGELTANAGGAGRIKLALPDGPVPARIDPDAFAILARNLIENALKHGSRSELVCVTLSVNGVLRVTNGGPAVPQELLTRLLNPFERGRAQAQGAGLGLAIAKAIATGTGSSLELLSPREGQEDGFEARLRIGRLG
ncbi:MAG: sensor histidine kinase N-terminal domain-containing protein [Bosea sp.]|uniref:sensor histidine kinase n=1 Tax=Bosea sp. (in: a-proteobacteria) TaxID=1871050 RepID=UPI001AC32302|nr:ATP-binding protein [Bosea sp. (in: a-proteobacteria)]MBN9451365.1 sensor histidine kinase N-terminal domain-containing protein [Bosea sp. (in: a-proteobacteria)]